MNLTPKQRRLVRDLIASDAKSFVALARIAELDPTTDFHEADLRDIDFGTDDLSGYNFRGSDLRGANLSHTWGLDFAILDDVVTDDATRWPVGWRALPPPKCGSATGSNTKARGLRLGNWLNITPVWSVAATLLSPLVRYHLRTRASQGKEIAARLAEREGIDTSLRPTGRLIWLHAATVGETLVVLPVIHALATRASDITILLTTQTVTSASLLAQRLSEMRLTDRVIHRFAPIDIPKWVQRFLNHWRPDVAGFVESDLWPNILTACRQNAIPTMLINARMSTQSRTAWSLLPGMAKAALGTFSRILAGGDEDAARLRTLGAAQVESLGDLKLAARALPAAPAVLRDMTMRFAGRPVFLAAETFPGEEMLIKAVHESLIPQHPNLITIIVPHHRERGAELAKALKAPRREAGPPTFGGLWIADSMGELGTWYRLSDAVFIGRSLLPPGGGRNVLEPARIGCAIATGPYTGNFTAHVALLVGVGGLTVVQDVSALTQFVGAMLADPSARRSSGERAKKVATAQGSLANDIAEALLTLMPYN